MRGTVSVTRHGVSHFLICLLLATFWLGCLVVGNAQSALKVEHDLTIPNARTPWAVDTYQSHPQLVPIHHSTIHVNMHRGANFAGELAGSFLYRPKVTTELDGLHARAQLHTKTPVFYLFLESDDDSGGDTKDAETYTFAIVKAGSSKDKRIMDRLSYNALTTKAKRVDELVETTSTRTPDGWIRIEPKQPMDEGEYCILPVPKTNGTYSTEVFDFGINLGAPNEKDVIAAVQP